MLSWSEIIVVFFIFLLLFGADKIPEFARTVGKMIGEYNRVRDSIREELDSVKREVDEAKDELDDVKEELDKAEREVEQHVESISEESYKELK